MKEFDEILVDTLYNRADSEQNVANRLYEGRSSDESYFIAAVTAQVLRNVAGALEQAKNIDSEKRYGIGLVNYGSDPVNAPERAVDPDIFRKQLSRLLDAFSDQSFPGELAPVIQESAKVLENNPISPARKVQAKYDRLLVECKNKLEHCIPFMDGTKDDPEHSQVIAGYQQLIERLEEVLAE